MGGIKLMKNKTAIHPEDSFSVKVVNETEYGVWVECSRCGTNTFIEYNNILPVRCSYCEVLLYLENELHHTQVRRIINDSKRSI
jgi:DNA-directed RNA polymerase subunit RPC12/RpoP